MSTELVFYTMVNNYKVMVWKKIVGNVRVVYIGPPILMTIGVVSI